MIAKEFATVDFLYAAVYRQLQHVLDLKQHLNKNHKKYIFKNKKLIMITYFEEKLGYVHATCEH